MGPIILQALCRIDISVKLTVLTVPTAIVYVDCEFYNERKEQPVNKETGNM